MKRRIFAAVLIAAIFAGLFFLATSDRFNEWVGTAFAGRFFSDQFALGKILAVEQHTVTGYNLTYPVQTMQVEFVTGPNKDQTVTIQNQGTVVVNFNQALHPGEIIVVGTNVDYEGAPYYMSDRFRLPAIILIFLAFIIAIVVVARWRGFTSLLGLGVSALILLLFIIPRILAGHNALWTIFIGAFLIAVASLYLAHGFNKRTSIAVFGTLITLGLSLGLAVLFVYLANIAGIGSEDVFYLKIDIANLNVTGLLLGSVLIGALGVLDDVTIGQSTTIEEIKRADPALSKKDLYARGMAVGREHIASLVNTLVLAYAGTSFPLLLLFILNKGISPYWSIFNGEQLGEEIIRTIVGSLGLILAVPITTFLAAQFFGRSISNEV